MMISEFICRGRHATAILVMLSGLSAASCSGDSAVAGNEVDVDVDVGGWHFDNPESVELLTLLDRFEVELVNGISEDIRVTAPPMTVSMTIVVEGQRDGMYALAGWVGPDGLDLVKNGWFNSEQQICFRSCANRIVSSEATFATIAPNNPAARIASGVHTFSAHGVVVQGFNTRPLNGTVKVTVHAKVAGRNLSGGVLDLNLHFTGANGWTAQTAQQDPDFLAMLEEVNEIYSQVGIGLGELAWIDVDESFRVLESMQGADSDLMELLSQSEGNEMNAVNLFFVDEIQSPFGMVLGIAGGIPGPTLMQGTPRSGVVVTVQAIEGAPGITTTVAHELGHFLGLFHTTEHFAIPGLMPEHDPLPDTPEHDVTYLMHAGGTGEKLSPWQGRVMRQNPWVRHLEVP